MPHADPGLLWPRRLLVRGGGVGPGREEPHPEWESDLQSNGPGSTQTILKAVFILGEVSLGAALICRFIHDPQFVCVSSAPSATHESTQTCLGQQLTLLLSSVGLSLCLSFSLFCLALSVCLSLPLPLPLSLSLSLSVSLSLLPLFSSLPAGLTRRLRVVCGTGCTTGSTCTSSWARPRCSPGSACSSAISSSSSSSARRATRSGTAQAMGFSGRLGPFNIVAQLVRNQAKQEGWSFPTTSGYHVR